MEKSAPQNTKTIFLTSVIVALIFCPVMLNAQKIDPTKFGEGAKEESEPWPNNEGVKRTRTTVKDKDGKIRQLQFTSVSEVQKFTGIGKTAPYIYRETKFTEFDCMGRPIFESTTNTENGSELNYSDATYEYNKWGDKYQTGGVERVTDKTGKTKTQKYDPKTKHWEIVSIPGNNEMNLASTIPLNMDCPVSIQNHVSIFIGPSYHREIYKGDGENFFGANFCLSVPINRQVEATADIAGYFKQEGTVHLNKYFFLAGANFYPIKKASAGQKFTFSLHGEAGVSVVALKVGDTKQSKTAFTYAAGPVLGFAVGQSTRIGIRSDLGQRMVKDNNSTNIRVSVGLMMEL